MLIDIYNKEGCKSKKIGKFEKERKIRNSKRNRKILNAEPRQLWRGCPLNGPESDQSMRYQVGGLVNGAGYYAERGRSAVQKMTDAYRIWPVIILKKVAQRSKK